MLKTFLDDAREWSRGKHWQLRFLLWLWLAYITVRHIIDPNYGSFLSGINLGIHEFGHLITMPFGDFVTVAGGSVIQLLVPVISVFMFYRQRDFFAYTFSLVWLGSNLFAVARYMADARALQLPLVTPFGGSGEIIHDWNYLLSHVGLLSYDTTIAGLLRFGAVIAMLAGVAWGAWILWQMFIRGNQEVGAQWNVPDVRA